MSGVVTMPPSGPSEVIEIVDPCSSPGSTDPERTASASRWISAALPQMVRVCASATTGTTRPVSVWAAIPM